MRDRLLQRSRRAGCAPTAADVPGPSLTRALVAPQRAQRRGEIARLRSRIAELVARGLAQRAALRAQRLRVAREGDGALDVIVARVRDPFLAPES